MITFDYEGGGVLANEYVIKNIHIFHKFLLNFGQILYLIFKIFSVQDSVAQIWRVILVEYFRLKY